jgi:16S rRNA (cytosine967-C5)-methyltransferase
LRPEASTDPHGLAPRRAALTLIRAVLDARRTLDDAKTAPAFAALAPAERARAGALAAAVLRRLAPIDALLAAHMRRPLDASAPTARDALRLALAEAAEGAPPYAATDAAVRLVKAERREATLAGLVNAVARRAAPQAAAALAGPEAAEASHPGWLRRRLRGAYGGSAAALFEANLAEAPLDVTLRDPAEADRWADALGAERLPTGSLRMRPRALAEAPGFAEGAWRVQDAAAALPARLFGGLRGRRALDLCAAPGGKTLQLADAGAEVTAVDLSEARLARLRENLERARREARVVAADVLEWRPETPGEAVLLDAPCTGTGVIRRHPDLPHLKRGADVAALAALQDRLLDAAWAMTAPGGALVFCTCSLLPEEGEARADAFLARTPDARLRPVGPEEVGEPAFLDARGRLRTRPDLWPERGGVDGFFAARFVRAA